MGARGASRVAGAKRGGARSPGAKMGARGALRVPRGAKRGGFGGPWAPPMTLISHPGLREGDLPLAQTGAGGARDCRTRPGTARGHAEQSLHIGAPVQALALDALAVTGQDAAAH